MCEDIDYSVCEAALELMTRLAELGLIGSEELQSLEVLVLAVNKSVAHPVCYLAQQQMYL